MQNDQTYSEIFGLVYTKDDFNLINNELDLLEEGLFELKDKSFDVVLNSLILEGTARLVSKLIKNEEKKQVLEKLKSMLSKIKFVEITVSTDLSLEFVKEISEWINKNTDQRIIGVCQKIAIDIKVDPSIIAGALISFEGKFFDGSVLRKMEEALKNYE